MNEQEPGRTSPTAPAAIAAAAVDLGSNSFHMTIGRMIDHDLHIVDRIREPVCLAEGLDAKRRLGKAAQGRALACLERFGQRLRAIPQLHVRAVGTSTLRRARNAGDFRSKAQAALGHPIEVISGQEEARLIFLGVAHSEFSADPRLVVDIGGGSTEVILGEGFDVVRGHSLPMGCVNYTREFFPDGALAKEAFKRAEIAAGLELHAIRKPLLGLGWSQTLGASGTINAVRQIIQLNGWGEGAIELSGLKRLRKALSAAGEIDALELDGLRSDRAAVLPGGLAILTAIFRRLELETMSTSSGALREGLLYDLLGRIRHEDVRDRTIRRLLRQYHVDVEQASRVERTALILLQQLCAEWRGEVLPRKLLIWAARLHEVGLAVSHSGFHKHGAYLIENADLPGFSGDDQTTLASLIRAHRGKLAESLFDAVPGSRRAMALRLSVILRLAVLLNRSRTSGITPDARVDPEWTELELIFSGGWLAERPLTRTDLERESRHLESLEIALTFRENAGPAAPG